MIQFLPMKLPLQIPGLNADSNFTTGDNRFGFPFRILSIDTRAGSTTVGSSGLGRGLGSYGSFWSKPGCACS